MLDQGAEWYLCGIGEGRRAVRDGGWRVRQSDDEFGEEVCRHRLFVQALCQLSGFLPSCEAAHVASMGAGEQLKLRWNPLHRDFGDGESLGMQGQGSVLS